MHIIIFFKIILVYKIVTLRKKYLYVILGAQDTELM